MEKSKTFGLYRAELFSEGETTFCHVHMGDYCSSLEMAEASGVLDLDGDMEADGETTFDHTDVPDSVLADIRQWAEAHGY